MIANRKNRVQAGHRILKDEAHFCAAHGLQVLRADFQQITPAQQDLPTAHICGGRRQQAQKRHHGHRLARPAFADDAQQFTRLQVKAYRIDRMNFTATGSKHRFKTPDIQNRDIKDWDITDWRGPIGHMTLPSVVIFPVW